MVPAPRLTVMMADGCASVEAVAWCLPRRAHVRPTPSYDADMAQDSPEWARLREELHHARKARKVTLDAVAGGLMTRGNVSKMESGGRLLTRPIVQRYAVLTGIDKFVTAFDLLVAKDANPNASPEDLPRLGAVLASTEVEQTIDFAGDMVKVIERRSVLPKIHNVEATSVGLHFGELEERRRPKVLPVEAYGAEIALQGWADRTNYIVAIKFPKDAIVVGKEPYEFSLIYQHEMPVPMLGMVPSDPLPLYRMVITLPPFATEVFELDGVHPEVLDEFIASVNRGETRSMRSRTYDASAEVKKDFLDLRPALFYGFVWFPRRRPEGPPQD